MRGSLFLHFSSIIGHVIGQRDAKILIEVFLDLIVRPTLVNLIQIEFGLKFTHKMKSF
jgi:hypothetical protein